MGDQAVNRSLAADLTNQRGSKKGFWMPYQNDTGKHSFFDLHPALRRSVCTLILATLAIVCGIVVILIEYLILDNSVSIVGLIFLSLGLVSIVIGLVWFLKSKQKLLLKWEKWEQARMKKIKDLTAAPFEKSNILPLTLMTSKHTAKWPSRKNCILAECKVTMTSPNGNHYVAPLESSYSDLEDEVALTSNMVYDATSPQVSSNNHEKNLSHDGFSVDYVSKGHAPIRISKNGEYSLVPRTEECFHHANHSSSEDEGTITSSNPRLLFASHN